MVACDPRVDSFAPAEPMASMSHSSFVSLPFGASLDLKIFIDSFLDSHTQVTAVSLELKLISQFQYRWSLFSLPSFCFLIIHHNYKCLHCDRIALMGTIFGGTAWSMSLIMCNFFLGFFCLPTLKTAFFFKFSPIFSLSNSTHTLSLGCFIHHLCARDS